MVKLVSPGCAHLRVFGLLFELQCLRLLEVG